MKNHNNPLHLRSILLHRPKVPYYLTIQTPCPLFLDPYLCLVSSFLILYSSFIISHSPLPIFETVSPIRISYMQQVEEALLKIEQIVLSTGIENDIIYFNYHKKRFHKMGETVSRIVPPGGTVLDIGSHYLHSSLLLSLMGYQVVSMDVSEFWELDYIRKRAADHQLTPVIENQLEYLASLDHETEKYDLILFTEIFEHITFNPINFWKRIHTLLKDKGKIYLTTPNSITLHAIIKTLFNVITCRGIGMDVNAIFPTVTYGHHWKEYSASEIKSYFSMLNDGFRLDIQKFHYKPTEKAHHLKSSLRILLTNLSNRIPFFKEAMEVVVTVDKSHLWKVAPPAY